MIQMNLFTKQERTHGFREWIYGYAGRVQARDRLGVLDWHAHTAIFKIIYFSMKKLDELILETKNFF